MKRYFICTDLVEVGGRSRKKHEDPPEGMYEEVDDSGRGERGTTPRGIKREDKLS